MDWVGLKISQYENVGLGWKNISDPIQFNPFTSLYSWAYNSVYKCHYRSIWKLKKKTKNTKQKTQPKKKKNNNNNNLSSGKGVKLVGLGGFVARTDLIGDPIARWE